MKPAIASRIYIMNGLAYGVCSECANTLNDSRIPLKPPIFIGGKLEFEELTGMPCQVRELVEAIPYEGIRAKAKSLFSIFGTDRS